MKKHVLFVLIGVLFFFAACDNGTLPADNDAPLEDPAFSLESADLGATTQLSSSMRAVSAPNGLKISFRSSDIEFWATGGDFTDLRSLKYDEWDGEVPGANLSTEIGLSDSEDNVVFMPNMVKLSDYVMPVFDKSLVYDVARMDIGNGTINFTMDGNVLNVSSPTLATGSIDANSIVFIDRAVLNNVVYVSRPEAEIIISDYLDGGLNGTYAFGVDTDFILDFIIANAGMGAIDDTYMDIDGAMFVPFDPVDFTGKSNANKVKIKLEWDLDTIFTAGSAGTYTLKETAVGTPYDFSVSIEIK